MLNCFTNKQLIQRDIFPRNGAVLTPFFATNEVPNKYIKRGASIILLWFDTIVQHF